MNKWSIYRNGGTDMDGEWRPSNSWSGKRKLFPGISIVINIFGRHRKNHFGLVPYRWYAKLSIHGYDYKLKSNHPSCNSIGSAVKYADKALTDEFLESSLKHFYTTKERVICISKIDDRGIAIPYFSYLGNYVNYMTLPNGKYVEAHRSPWWESDPEKVQIRTSSIKRFPGGYSGAGIKVEVPTWAWS